MEVSDLLRYAISFLVVIVSMIALGHGSSVCDNAPCEPVINAKVGDEFNITIPSNPSTGFSWWADFNPQFLTLAKTGSIADNVSPEMTGLPETKFFTYRAVFPGETEVYLLLLQPWENGSIAEKFIYPVKIVP